jgi:3-hydroxyisobutyrate dehydrogenase
MSKTLEPQRPVGIVGYGAMGTEVAYRLQIGGTQPFVFEVNPESRDRATRAGLEVVTSAAELGRQCAVVLVLVRTDDELLEVTMGQGGALEGMASGGTIVVHSTVLPRTTLAIAEKASHYGVEVVDACITATPDRVHTGNITFLVGGSDDVVDRLRPLLLLIGGHILHLGPLGAGNGAKLIKNLVTGSERVILYEAVLLAQALGIPYPKILDMLRTTASEHTPVIERWEATFDPSGTNPVPRSGSNTLSKDMPLAAELGREEGVDLPLITQLANSALSLVEMNRKSGTAR